MLRNGIDVFQDLGSDFLRNLGRVAVVANQCSLAATGQSSVHVIDQALLRASATPLVAVYGPQHGYYQTEQDNMIETPDTTISLSGGRVVPLWSLYSQTRAPVESQIELFDTIIVDLQDIGCRVYTYMLTLAGCMRALSGKKKKVVVLDRPNPLGLCYFQESTQSWERIEGPLLEKKWESFVGWYALPMRHGMTMGELACYFKEADGLDVDLQVIKVDNLKRNTKICEVKNRVFHMPSPNIPCWDSAFFFPSFVSLEGTNISEGRGTTVPFQLVGAPRFDFERFKTFFFFLKQKGFLSKKYAFIDGLDFCEHHFRPTFNKFVGSICKGVRFTCRDPESIHLLTLGFYFMCYLKLSLKADFLWKKPGYEYNLTDDPIHLIMGNSFCKEIIDGLSDEQSFQEKLPSIDAFLKKSHFDAQDFCVSVNQHLLYG